MDNVFQHIDSLLISLFRIVDTPITGYYLGTAIICVICFFIGKVTLRISSSFNSSFLQKDRSAMVHMHNLSMKALAGRDKTAYTSCNKQANEAFGKVFFTSVALGSSALWPVPFALAWMQYRFGQVQFELPVELPVVGSHTGYLFTFFPILVLTYIFMGRFMSKINSLRALKNNQVYPEDLPDQEHLLTFKDITSQPG